MNMISVAYVCVVLFSKSIMQILQFVSKITYFLYILLEIIFIQITLC